MYQDQQQVIETIKQKYFQGLQNQIHQMVKNKDFKIITFLYNVVFDNSYYQLTQVYNQSELELNNQIVKVILYPISELELNNTEQLIQVIPWFLLFLIGQNLDINQCLNQDNQNLWEMFLIAVTKMCNYDISAKEYFRIIQMNLETKFKQIQSINLEETVNLIVRSQKLLELLNQMFYQDYYHFTIRSQNSQDPFVNFQHLKKLQIIMNSYQFLQQRDKGKIISTIEDSKMKVAISFIEKNYLYDYLDDKFHNIQAGIAIFSLIQLDHKQFQNFFYSKRPSVQEQLLNQIMDIAEVSDNLFFNLFLVGKCLSKLRQWEYALKVYAKLQYLISNHQDKEKFRIYIYFKICKIQFLQGQIKELKKKLKQLNNVIEQRKNQNIEFYQPNNREIYNQSLIIQLLISVYTNSKDLRRDIMIKITPIIMLNDQSTQKRNFNMLQYEFFRLIKQQGIIFKGEVGKMQLQFILNKTQSICKERQDIESKNTNFLTIITGIFDSKNQKGEKLIEIKSYYKAVQEFLIINVLLRQRQIFILQYFNPNLYPLLRVFLASNNFFNLRLKSQIYFFIHDFKEAYQLAQQTQNHKMIGEILEYWGRFEDAIEFYKNVNSSNSEINCAILFKIIYDQTSLSRNKVEKRESYENFQKNAIQYFSNLVQNQGQYQIIAKKYLEILLQEFQEEDDYFKSNLNLNFPIRKDIKQFYHMLRNDLGQEQDNQLRNKLDEFVKKTQFLKYETSELFNNNKLGQQIGQGGNSQVYKFNFQGQSYAAKMILLEYMGENINQDEKSDIENKLQEICIICDITISKTKYCLGIEHLGLQLEICQGKLRRFQIILITKIYNNYQEMINWDEIDKIKYIYKLSLGLTTLQMERQLLHQDLKPDNVLVDSIKKNPIIADFGSSNYSQRSQYLSCGVRQMTYKYIDPKLLYSNYKSRKNDVYSFGVTVFQYFSGCIPYEGLQDYRILSKNKQFQENHKEIQNIKNNFIQDLIIDCTNPIANRISFILVIKRLFMYQYSITNPQVKQLIEILFDYIEYQQNDRTIITIYPYLKVMKSFIKYTNSFQTTRLENRVLQNYEILFSMTSNSISSFTQIIQRMKQFINWAMLNQHDFVLKLIDFQINCNQINQDQMQITFNFWVEDAQKILSTNMILQIPFYLNIVQILKQIHQYSICLLQISLEQIYIKDDKIKLNCFEYSQNLKIDQNKLYELNCFNIDPDINQSMKFKYQNDIYALFVLIQQTREQSILDQDIQDKICQLLQFINQNQVVISLEEIIGKLQH